MHENGAILQCGMWIFILDGKDGERDVGQKKITYKPTNMDALQKRKKLFEAKLRIRQRNY